jgi:hypothetical protein
MPRSIMVENVAKIDVEPSDYAAQATALRHVSV